MFKKISSKKTSCKICKNFPIDESDYPLCAQRPIFISCVLKFDDIALSVIRDISQI